MSTGYDDVCTKVVKYVSSAIAPILSHVFNLCIEQGIFPEKLKYTIIKPIYKKGEKSKLTNYRPIAMISIFSKILERIIYNNLYQYFENNRILANEQKGFRKGRSIEEGIFEFLDKIYVRVDNRKPVYALYLDMSKAFDCVNHDLLLNKLERYGIRGNALQFINSYLSGRTQITKINKICTKTRVENWYSSDSRLVTCGVPQGSILGPLLFIIYINDLPNNIHNEMILFADDITIVYYNKDDIKISIDNIVDWLQNNNLNVNIEKTKLMTFQQREYLNITTDIQFNNVQIEDINSTKFLGIHIDRNLKWQSHTEVVCKRICTYSYVLFRLSKILDRGSVLVAYHGCVASILRYGLIFWGATTESERVFIAQKRCVRAVCGLQRMDSCRPYFKELKLLTLPSMYIYETAIYVFRHQLSLRNVIVNGDVIICAVDRVKPHFFIKVFLLWHQGYIINYLETF